MIELLAAPEPPVVFFCPLCGWEIDFGPDPREGARGQVPHVPGSLRAATRRRRLDPRAPGAVTSLDEARSVNLALWNEWTRIHERSQFYDVAGFKAGRSSLKPLERAELGDVDGKTPAASAVPLRPRHAQLGAAGRHRHAGVDFSDEAIALARRLADEVGLAGRASFVQSDVLELGVAPGGPFDIVFVSYGAIEWLPDLERWAASRRRQPQARRRLLHGRDPSAGDASSKRRPITDVRIAYPYFPDREPDPRRGRGLVRRPRRARRNRSLLRLAAQPRRGRRARSSAPGCGSSTCTSSPTRCSPSGAWMEPRDGWYWLPDDSGGLRTDHPLPLLHQGDPAGLTRAAHDRPASARPPGPVATPRPWRDRPAQLPAAGFGGVLAKETSSLALSSPCGSTGLAID